MYFGTSSKILYTNTVRWELIFYKNVIGIFVNIYALWYLQLDTKKIKVKLIKEENSLLI